MKAVVLRAFGPPSQLQLADVPEPTPGSGQALIDVGFASITFVDTQIRAGRPPNPATLPRLPVVLGNGVGGVVAAVGDAEHAALVGRTVVAGLGGSGGYAERVVADVAALVDVPSNVSLRDAVALLADGRTAMLLLRAAAVRSGEAVLVEAAAGGVGSLLVQLGRNAGARVIGAAGSARKLSVVSSLGAEMVVDYSMADWAEQLRAACGGSDVVFDGVGGGIGGASFVLV